MINNNRSRESCLFRISWSPCRLSCPFLRATKVAIQNSIEAPAITNLVLNSWLIRLGSLLVSRPGPTPPTLRCTHAMLYESLFISLVSWLSSIVVSLVSDLDDYLPILFNSFDLLYTIQYLIQLFFFKSYSCFKAEALIWTQGAAPAAFHQVAAEPTCVWPTGWSGNLIWSSPPRLCCRRHSTSIML